MVKQFSLDILVNRFSLRNGFNPAVISSSFFQKVNRRYYYEPEISTTTTISLKR